MKSWTFKIFKINKRLSSLKAHGENAPSIMSIIYFDELAENKKIYLEMGEVDATCLKYEEAKFLLNQMKLYYLKASENDDKFKLIETFHQTPAKFKHMDLIKQLEKDNLRLDNFK